MRSRKIRTQALVLGLALSLATAVQAAPTSDPGAGAFLAVGLLQADEAAAGRAALHRDLLDHLRRLLGLIGPERGDASSGEGTIRGNGLSDDPDPTGITGDGRDDGGNSGDDDGSGGGDSQSGGGSTGIGWFHDSGNGHPK